MINSNLKLNDTVWYISTALNKPVEGRVVSISLNEEMYDKIYDGNGRIVDFKIKSVYNKIYIENRSGIKKIYLPSSLYSTYEDALYHMKGSGHNLKTFKVRYTCFDTSEFDVEAKDKSEVEVIIKSDEIKKLHPFSVKQSCKDYNIY